MSTINDKAVLNCIFNPFEPVQNCFGEDETDSTHHPNGEANSSVTSGTNGSRAGDDERKGFLSDNILRDHQPDRMGDADGDETPEEAIKLEVKGIEAAEANDLETAINYFDSAIKIAPRRASCFNNRAQAKRMNSDTQGALEDLNLAINLSGGSGVAARQAFCQRACIHYLEGRIDEAHSDFNKAASLGSQFAKTMAVKTNPYAALCNQMLRDMIQNLTCPSPASVEGQDGKKNGTI